ncbi:MAG: hypothetical protein HY313_03310 [Acidobacteria bacterium]|nr:hypothetical protein [Acidobacteriota bacterium]
MKLSPKLARRSMLFRRYGGIVLLASFATDIGFHSVSSILKAHSPTISITNISAGEAPVVPYDPDCGIPEHKGSGFHHHHFFALISHVGFTLPFAMLKLGEPHRASPALYVPVVARLSRAPPLA